MVHLRPRLARAARTAAALAMLVPAAAHGADGVPGIADFLPPAAELDPQVPRPSEVLGHAVGERFARHHAAVTYLERLAAHSPRIEVRRIGMTPELRPQIAVFVSAPARLRALPDARRAHLANEPDGPLVTWHGYSIHGNEASGTNAALVVAYWLAASRSEAVANLLERTVVILDPALNPDGYARFAGWANQHLGRVPVDDPAHRERREPWPRGRTNHYWFDLNRDWLLAQQPETRSRLALLRRWRPHLVADHHEMRAERTFFFQPGVPERVNPLIPERNQAITARLAERHAALLDAYDRLYYSEETFDDFYPGKGSTWPDLRGGVGILFEQASPRGVRRSTENGVLTLAFAVHNHVLTTRSTLEGADALADDLKALRRRFEAGRHRRGDGARAWVFDDGGDPDRARALRELLHRQGVAVHRLAAGVEAGGTRFEPERAWIVPAEQRLGTLARALFERRTEFGSSTFYDVSGWTVTAAFGVRDAALRRAFRERLVGARLESEAPREATPPSVTPETAAWVLPWRRFFAPAALDALLAAGARARVALAPFTARTPAGERRFARGAVVVHRSDLSARAAREALGAAAAQGVAPVPLTSGLTVDGPELGSPRMAVVARPRVALLVGEGVNPYDAGAAWHALDARLGLPVTLLEAGALSAAALERHTHLIATDGSYDALPGDAGETVTRWVEAGGHLVVTRRAIDWAMGAELLPARAGEGEMEGEAEASTAATTPERHPYASMARRDGAQQVGGAVVSARLDRTHPLAFGVALERIGLLRQGRTLLRAPADDPFASVAVYDDEPLVSGYLPEGFDDRLAGTPAVLARPRGRGTVIAFADDPAFRAVWWVGQRLLANALFFADALQRPSGRYGE